MNSVNYGLILILGLKMALLGKTNTKMEGNRINQQGADPCSFVCMGNTEIL